MKWIINHYFKAIKLAVLLMENMCLDADAGRRRKGIGCGDNEREGMKRLERWKKNGDGGGGSGTVGGG